MAESTWSWPVANDPPGHLGNNTVVDMFPTRYKWRLDVEQRARWLVDTFNVWCHSWYDHPPGWASQVASTDPDGTVWYIENTSFDVWGPQGRFDPIDSTVGQQVFDTLFNDPNSPTINCSMVLVRYYGGKTYRHQTARSFGLRRASARLSTMTFTDPMIGARLKGW